MARVASLLRPVMLVIAAYAVMLAFGWLGFGWTRGSQKIAALWLPNAILVVIFLRARGWTAPALIVAGWLANVTAGLLVGSLPIRITAFATINTIEVLAVCWAMRRARIERPDFGNIGDLARFAAIAGFAVPVASGLLTTGLRLIQLGRFELSAWLAWSMAHGLGMMVGGTLIMIFADGWRRRHLLTRKIAGEAALILSATLFATILVFAEARVPIFFVACPLVLIAAFRLGSVGTAMSITLMVAVAGVVTALGGGPITWVNGDLPTRILVVQSFLAVNFAIGLPVAAMLTGVSRTQQELHASRDFARSMLDNMREVIFRTNRDGRWIFLNDAWTDLTGYPVIDSLGQTAMQLVHPDDLPEAIEIYEKLVSGELDEWLVEVRFHAADDSCRHVEVSSRALRDPDGSFAGTIGNIRDVTERRAVETALRESESRFQTLSALSPVGIVRTDALGYANYFNAAWSDLTGLSGEAAATGGWLAGLSEEDRAAVVAARSRMMGDRQAHRREFRYTRPDGTMVWIDTMSTPEIDANDEIIGHIGVALDITDRKELEIALATARDAAENAADAKATFLANMSHEIRTPMNAVIGFIELLLASDLDAEQQRHARLIADSGWAMMRLLNDILDVSKIDAGQMQMIREAVDVRHELSACVKLMEPIAASKGIILYSDIDEDVPDLIMGDGLRIRQIVLNLVVNALKFTEKGTVTIFAGILKDEDGPRLEIEVSDTGVGIAPERQAAIFDQFVQSDVTIAQHFGGTGLGLTISSQLAKLMAGDLTLDSTPGAGTSFFLRLPLEVAPARPAVTVALPAPAVVADGVRVLVAEDNDVNQLLLTAMLDRFDCDIVSVTDGEQAVSAVLDAAHDGRPFDLVLMDVQMPVLDGIEATRLIRASGIGGDRLPIVALTANAFADSIKACLDAGMQDHYAKPLTLADLERALSRWVPSASADRAADQRRAI